MEGEIRGGGESGLEACTNSVGANLTDVARAGGGWEKIAAAGSKKTTADVKEGLFSWQQDTEQLAIPVPP